MGLTYRNHSLYSLPTSAPLILLLCIFSGDIHMSLCRKTGETVDVDFFLDKQFACPAVCSLLWKSNSVWISQATWKNMHNPQIWGQNQTSISEVSPNCMSQFVPNIFTIKLEVTWLLETSMAFLLPVFSHTCQFTVKNYGVSEVRQHHPMVNSCTWWLSLI